MNKQLLFTDGSVNIQSKTGYGASLLITGDEVLDENLRSKVKTKCFENTSSTKLELQTLLWALNDIVDKERYVNVYTDSSNIIQLLKRRQRLEKNDFRSKQGLLLKNHDLYKEFYQLIDSMDCEFVKVRGHQPSRKKSEIERVFALVDKASRKALRTGI